MADRRWGHVKLSRKFFEEDPWWNEDRPRTKAEAWLDCIAMAAWKPRKYAVGMEIERLERGEFLASIRFLAERWQWDKMTVSRYLDVCQECGRLQRQREIQGGSVYLLVNYELYQGNDSQRETPAETPGETPERQQRDKTEAVKAGNKILADLVAKGLDIWKAEMGGTLSFPRVRKAWKALLDDYSPAEILERWEFYFTKMTGEDRRYVSPENFASRIALYLPEMEMTDDLGQMKLHRKNPSGEWEVVA